MGGGVALRQGQAGLGRGWQAALMAAPPDPAPALPAPAVVKPLSSRPASAERFVLCLGRVSQASAVGKLLSKVIPTAD